MAKEEENFAKICPTMPVTCSTFDVPTQHVMTCFALFPRTTTCLSVSSNQTERHKSVCPHPSEPIAVVEQRRPASNCGIGLGIHERSPRMSNGGEQVGEATCAVTPWPHQVRAFDRLYGKWPTKLLIADEVGLGKTVQAGLLIRQALLSGRAKRILIMVPRNIRPQWQVEMREKFNLNIPIYNGHKLVWYDSRLCAASWNGRSTERLGTRNR